MFKLLKSSCTTWSDCVKFSRHKFEKYFLHKALRLLHHFPPDAQTGSGLFWSHPKKLPNASVVFSADNELHLDFVRTLAQCWAVLWRIEVCHKFVKKCLVCDIHSTTNHHRFDIEAKISSSCLSKQLGKFGVSQDVRSSLMLSKISCGNNPPPLNCGQP